LRAVQDKGGTTFLIQGAPGAGKTALLDECERHAREKGWETVEIDPPALWDPDELRHYLGLGNIPEVTEASAQVGAASIVKVEAKAELPQRTTLKILRGGKQPLLLKLDEAQTLGTVNAPPSGQDGTASNVLKAIHNGKLNRPVILIVGGLGTTVEAFESLGISRFSATCLVELGALSKESERAVIHDWLKKDGGADGDPTAWIDAIAQETHGWPQHILSYVEPALRQLRADGEIMTLDGLNAVLKAGCRGRSAYYEHRAHDFEEKERHCLAKSFAEVPLGESIPGDSIRASLTQEYGPAKAEKLFHQALNRGILSKRGGRYSVPIPSMQDWLVVNYARI